MKKNQVKKPTIDTPEKSCAVITSRIRKHGLMGHARHLLCNHTLHALCYLVFYFLALCKVNQVDIGDIKFCSFI